MKRLAWAAVLCVALAGCATNPYAMRDYGVLVEQARKVGAGGATAPAAAPAGKPNREPESEATQRPKEDKPAAGR